MRRMLAVLVVMCCVALDAGLSGATDERAASSDPGAGQGAEKGPTPKQKAESPAAVAGRKKQRAQAIQSRVAALLAAYEATPGDAEAAKFVAAALQGQADSDVAWDRAWGDAIDELRQEGKVSDEQHSHPCEQGSRR